MLDVEANEMDIQYPSRLSWDTLNIHLAHIRKSDQNSLIIIIFMIVLIHQPFYLT